MRLDRYQRGDYKPGAPLAMQLLWFFVGDFLVRSQLIAFSDFKVWILRLFGAEIGKFVRMKPGVKVKFPWRLKVGDYSWIGEDVWIDNLASVEIGAHCCISQGAYFCTGNHNWVSEGFDLITQAITISDHAWIAAKSVVGPGVKIGEGSVLSLGSVTTSNLDAWFVYQGNPAQKIGPRPREKQGDSGGEQANENSVH